VVEKVRAGLREGSLQQFREVLPGGHPYRFVIHDRDRIFALELDKVVADMDVRILRTPVRAPKADSVCERYRCRYQPRHRTAHIATVYRQAKLFAAKPFSVACTTSTGWKRWRQEARMELLRTTG
jgi:hypothetical protein